jgi:hypothetical protein
MDMRLLTVVPVVALVVGPLVAAGSPRIAGIAFFYWYELAWVLIAGALAFVGRPAKQQPQPAAEEPRFSRDPSIRRRPSRTLTRAG